MGHASLLPGQIVKEETVYHVFFLAHLLSCDSLQVTLLRKGR